MNFWIKKNQQLNNHFCIQILIENEACTSCN